MKMFGSIGTLAATVCSVALISFGCRVNNSRPNSVIDSTTAISVATNLAVQRYQWTSYYVAKATYYPQEGYWCVFLQPLVPMPEGGMMVRVSGRDGSVLLP